MAVLFATPQGKMRKLSAMSIITTVLFESPRKSIAPLVSEKLRSSIDTRILTGFATPPGVEAILPALAYRPDVIHTLVVGLGTHGAYAALDRLIERGLPADRMFVHLGRTRYLPEARKSKFERYHPMLHSKIYYMEHANGTASAFIGSHNLTHFAMGGDNGEAAVLLEGERNSPEFEKIRLHIAAARKESSVYSPERKTDYSWWTLDYLSGVLKMANDAPADGEAETTIVILCEKTEDQLPVESEHVYFELPSISKYHSAFRAEVHLYIFDRLPSSPEEALRRAALGQATASRWCRVEGLQRDRSGVELKANWSFSSQDQAALRRVEEPFRPDPKPDTQQILAAIYKEVWTPYEYLFVEPTLGQLPVLDDEQSAADFQSLGSVSEKWPLVRDLRAAEPDEATTHYHEVLRQLNPKSGSYLLLSQRRRRRDRPVGAR